MSEFTYLLIFALGGSLISLVGGFILIANKKRGEMLANYATPFAAGALLAAAFVDLLPDAIDHGGAARTMWAALVGIISFFLLERFLRWFHHHHEHANHKTDPNTSLVVIGDTLHNAIDGVAIAVAFLVGVPTGVIATLAVAAHEIPQEIGDFGLLLKKGVSKAGVIKINIASALATVLSAALFYQFGNAYELPMDIILGVVAGFFIYIATSDIIPSIHRHEDRSLAGHQTLMLLIGVIVVGLLTTYVHDLIEVEPPSPSSSAHYFTIGR